ncbi:hypothetical protein Tco_0517518 [Tanacetum coccineum]
MNAIQAFLKEYDHIPPKEKCMAFALAEERFVKVKQVLEEGQNQPENVQELLLKLLNDLQILNKVQLKQEEQAAKICTPYWKPPIFYIDEESSIPLIDITSELPLSIAVTPDFPITDSLIMEDEHLDTIPKTESNEENESSVEDLNLTPSESEDLSDIESECNMPVFDDFMTFSNPLFDSNDDFTSSDGELFSNEDVPEEKLKIYSNPLFDEEIISTKIDSHHFNAESDLKESLLNRDTSISFSLSPIPVEGSDSLMKEIDIFLAPDDLIPMGIENDDYDSEGDILEELLNNDSLSLPENESFHFDRYYDPSFPRPLTKPPDDDGIYFDAEPDTGILTVKVVDDISERYVLKPRILPTQPTLSLCPVIDTLFLFSSENEDKVFNTGILASKEEKSPHLLSHPGFKAFQLISNFSESPMMIYEGNIPILDQLVDRILDDEESLGEDASKQGRIDAIDADEDITVVSVYDMNVSTGEEVAEEVVKVINTTKLIIDAAQDDIHAKIDADHQLAERLQAQEQEELFVKEKATLFQQLLYKRRKHFAAKRAEEKRNKPPTKAQQRKIMCTYLKNMKGYKLKDLKSKGFDSIQEMFDRAFKRVNTFEDFRIELVEGKEKRARAQEIAKKQKVEDDKETAEIKKLMEIIPDEEEVAIDAIPLVVKSPSIVDWKIHKEGRKSHYQIIRVDGKSQMYMIFSHMLKSFDREDLETLYKLVKSKYESTRPMEDLDLIL